MSNTHVKHIADKQRHSITGFGYCLHLLELEFFPPFLTKSLHHSELIVCAPTLHTIHSIEVQFVCIFCCLYLFWFFM